MKSRQMQYLTAVLLLTTLWAVAFRSLDLRIASQGVDDGPILYSYLMKYPARYAHDPASAWGKLSTVATMQNWLPALLYTYLDVSPRWWFALQSWAQVLLPGLLLFWLAAAIGLPFGVQLSAAVLYFALEPLRWNFANYNSLLFVPYAAQIAIPISAAAVILFLANRVRSAAVLFLLTGLWHPAWACQILATLWVITLYKGYRKAWSFRRSVATACAFGFSSLLFMVPSILLGRHTPLAPYHVWLAGILKNPHMVPWLQLGRMLDQVPIVLGLALALLYGGSTIRIRRGTPIPARTLGGVCVVTGIALAIAHLAYLETGFAQGMIVAGFRYAALVSFVSLPFALAVLYRPGSRWIGRYASVTILCASLAAAAGAARTDRRDALASRADLRVQLWARDHTPKDAMFLLPSMPWRSLSERAGISPLFLWDYLVYSRSRASYEIAKRMNQLVGIETCRDDQTCTFPTPVQEILHYDKLSFEALTHVARASGCTYIVTTGRRAGAPCPLFANQSYVVYAVTP